MKRKSKLSTLIFSFNIVIVLLLLLACFIPHIISPYLSFLTFIALGVPILVVLNILFLAFWLIQQKFRRAIPSLTILVLGYFVLGTFFKINFKKAAIHKEDLSVLSYNVRVFNINEDLESKTVFEDIKSFIELKDPDIVCFQEPDYRRVKEYESYPYKFLEYINLKGKGLHGIFSKYPIINQGLVDFPNTHSSAAFADIQYKQDTIRIYSVHLESLGITPGKGTLRNEPSDKLFKMLSTSFRKQHQQAAILKAHRESVNYKVILCGDFNNTQFSNVYQTIKGDMKDSFVEEGSGYGRTLNFHGVPVRIDFILADPDFKIKSHSNYDVIYSDHFPIMASFELDAD